MQWDHARIEVLAKRACSGDERAFAELRALLDPMVKKLCSGMRANGLDDDDLGMVAEQALWDSVKTWSPDRALFATYAWTTIRSKLFTAVRASLALKRQANTYAEELPLHLHCPASSDHSLFEAWDVIERALEGRPSEMRIVKGMYAEGLDVRDVAEMMGVSEKWVYQLLSRAKGRIAKAYALVL